MLEVVIPASYRAGLVNRTLRGSHNSSGPDCPPSFRGFRGLGKLSGNPSGGDYQRALNFSLCDFCGLRGFLEFIEVFSILIR